jgi:hypothetical protein
MGSRAASPSREYNPPVSERAELVLVPADQRRNEEAGEAKVVVRLNRELDRGEQVLDHDRLVQVKPVDAGDRHAGREQARDDQRGQFAPAADQYQDVAGCQRPLGRRHHRRLLDHLPDPFGKRVGIFAVADADPALFALVAVVGRFLDRERPP